MVAFIPLIFFSSLAQVSDARLPVCERPAVNATWNAISGNHTASSAIYIEPSAFVASRQGEVLLAGEPTLVWHAGAADPEVNSVVGVQLNARAEVVRFIPSSVFPEGASVGLRTAQIDSSSWLFVGPVKTTSGQQVVSARWDGKNWTAATTLPSTSPARPLPEFGTGIVNVAGGVALVMPAQFPDGLRVLALYRFVSNRWRVNLFRPQVTGQAALSYKEAEGLALAATGIWSSREGRSANILVYTEKHGWNRPKYVVRLPSTGTVHELAWSSDQDASALIWTALADSRGDLEAWAIRDVFADSASPKRMAKHLANHVEYLVGGGEWRNRFLWVITQEYPNGERRLKVLDVDDEVTVLYDQPNIFDATVKALWKTPDELWIAGGAEKTAQGRTIIESRLLRLMFRCG